MTLQLFTFKPSDYTPFMQTAMVDIGHGIELCVEVGGNPKNPAVLLIMGLGMQCLCWDDAFVKKFIDKGFYVIRYDNRDIGLSTKFTSNKFKNLQVRNKTHKQVDFVRLLKRTVLGLATHDEPIKYRLDDMAEDALGLLNALKIDEVNVIGASMGGMIAQLLAEKYPERVQSLGLLYTSNLSPLLPPPFPKQMHALLGKPKSTDESAMIEHSIKVFKAISSPDYFDKTKCADMARKLYRRSFSPLGFRQQLFAIMAQGSMVESNRNIKVPTIVIHGSKDRLIHPLHGKHLAQNIKKSHFVKIQGMGHDLQPHFQDKLVNEFTKNFARF